MSSTQKNRPVDEGNLWEEGKLGQSEAYVRVATDAEMKEVDDATDLHPISIRLQRQLIDALKEIAKYHGIGYQPMIRDLLNRFARSEIREILQERLQNMSEDDNTPEMKPVDDFIRKMKDAA